MELLIKYIFLMNILHDVSPYDCMQVRFHKIEYEIDIFIILCFEDILKRNYIGVSIQLLKENDLGYGNITSR